MVFFKNGLVCLGVPLLVVGDTSTNDESLQVSHITWMANQPSHCMFDGGDDPMTGFGQTFCCPTEKGVKAGAKPMAPSPTTGRVNYSTAEESCTSLGDYQLCTAQALNALSAKGLLTSLDASDRTWTREPCTLYQKLMVPVAGGQFEFDCHSSVDGYLLTACCNGEEVVTNFPNHGLGLAKTMQQAQDLCKEVPGKFAVCTKDQANNLEQSQFPADCVQREFWINSPCSCVAGDTPVTYGGDDPMIQATYTNYTVDLPETILQGTKIKYSDFSCIPVGTTDTYFPNQITEAYCNNMTVRITKTSPFEKTPCTLNTTTTIPPPIET